MTHLPFSQACENNKDPILEVLSRVLQSAKHVLEIGSGTGQHAVHFSSHLPHLHWQPSDQQEYLEGLSARIQAFPQRNLSLPIKLDVLDTQWPNGFDAVFSANTTHIMPWPTALHMLKRIAELLPQNGVFALYGPFNYQGKFTSKSNARFDVWLKQTAVHQGIRNFEDIDSLLSQHNLTLLEDNPMPANNRMLVWRKA